ncbi:MAG: Rcat domain-containing protein [Acidimicrobiales bacterium]
MTIAVPWCEKCSRMVEDSELTESGTCPACGTELEERRKVPWHFKLMIGVTVVYLGYRAYQGIGWVVHHA